MKLFLKENRGFFSLLGVFSAICLSLAVYSCSLEDDFEVIDTKSKSTHNALRQELNRQADYNDVADNLRVANEDSEVLAKYRRVQINELRTILNKDGILADADRKSSQDVNSDLQRFIRQYREKLYQKGIKIKGVAPGIESGAGFPGGGGGQGESFGFSKYDGQWPSFEVAEAREVYKQKQIILQLLDKLIQAKGNDPSQPLEILGVKRELAGEEDAKKKDRESLSIESMGEILAKRADKIETYAFRIELLGRTAILRSFISQLELPFIVSDVEVHRAEGRMGAIPQPEDAPLPFGLNLPKESTSSVPIITNVNSRFLITIEYLMAIHASPEQFLKTFYTKKNEEGTLQVPPEDISTLLSEQVFSMKPEDYAALLQTIYGKDDE